jgi:signal transduction histidine kinase
MIKKLRVKFIVVIMSIVTLMLLVVFGFVLRNTYFSLERGSLTAMQEFAREPMRPGFRPGEIYSEQMLMFTLVKGADGELKAYGSSYFDLSDGEEMLRIYQAAESRGETTGILSQWNLRYYRDTLFGMTSYVFMDISVQMHMMEELVTTCALLFGLIIVLFFLISLWLSKWIVKPVAEAWNRQRQFVADASHELKTPLTVILTNAELLQSGEYDAPAQERFTRSILTMSRQMRGLVESLLDLARIDSGKVRGQFGRIDMSQLVEDCVLGFEPVYFESGKELVCQIEPGIFAQGSDSYLRQVVDILLDNGCKYGTLGQSVQLVLQRQGRGKMLLTVASKGTALTPSQCKDIFKRFYRVDEARAMNHSYGLGLPIADSIVQEHGGKIWAAATEEGNVFYVQLPTL